MKTILVPTEQNAGMASALDAALLFAKKFGSCIEGFPLRPAVADMVAMDPDAGMTMVAVKENDADMVRQAEDLFRSFMERHGISRLPTTHRLVGFAILAMECRSAKRPRLCRQLWPRVRPHRRWPVREKNGRARQW